MVEAKATTKLGALLKHISALTTSTRAWLEASGRWPVFHATEHVIESSLNLSVLGSDKLT